MTRTLGTLSGLTQIGLHIVRLEKGRESTEYHYHDADEEFLYVISGRGVAINAMMLGLAMSWHSLMVHRRICCQIHMMKIWSTSWVASATLAMLFITQTSNAAWLSLRGAGIGLIGRLRTTSEQIQG